MSCMRMVVNTTGKMFPFYNPAMFRVLTREGLWFLLFDLSGVCFIVKNRSRPSAKLKMIPLSISSKRPQYELSTIIRWMAAILHQLKSIRAGK